MQVVAVRDLNNCNLVFPDPKRKEINKSDWIQQYPDGSITFTLKQYQRKMLLQACKIYQAIGKIPTMIYDEEPIIAVPNYEFFVRFNQCSCKDGIHGTKPLTSYRQLLENIISSKRIISVLEEEELPCLYISKYRSDWNGLEFRCFMYQGELTAISQYHWFEIQPLIETFGSIENLCQLLMEFWFNNRDKLKSIEEDVVFDVVWNGKEIELVECNAFSTQCGPALFNWQEDTLFEATNIEFRYYQGQ